MTDMKRKEFSEEKMKYLYRIIFITLIVLYFCGHYACSKKPALPKNIILCISDGCGYNCFDAASLYQYGKTGEQVYENFPVKYAVSTYSADGNKYDPDEAWRSFDFVKKAPTDSAASATAMATGVKTYNGAINVDVNKTRLETVLERAEKLGKASGVVTTVMFAHATPACFVAHNEERSNFIEITREMIFESPVDVIMGCGHPYYDKKGHPVEKPVFKYVGGEDTWNALLNGNAGGDADGDGISDPWVLIQSRAEFQSLVSGPTPKRVIGIPYVYHTLQEERGGDMNAAPYAVPLIESMPTLEEMTAAALNILDEDKDGFFLMIEGGAVDWAGHDMEAGRIIEEQIDFNKTVEVVVNWVEKHSTWEETLVIVTTDHETGYIYGPGSGVFEPGEEIKTGDVWKLLVNNGKGNLPGMEWHCSGHTNSLVPLYARGVCSGKFDLYADEYDPVRGKYLDNTEIAKLIFSILN